MPHDSFHQTNSNTAGLIHRTIRTQYCNLLMRINIVDIVEVNEDLTFVRILLSWQNFLLFVLWCIVYWCALKKPSGQPWLWMCCMNKVRADLQTTTVHVSLCLSTLFQCSTSGVSCAVCQSSTRGGTTSLLWKLLNCLFSVSTDILLLFPHWTVTNSYYQPNNPTFRFNLTDSGSRECYVCNVTAIFYSCVWVALLETGTQSRLPVNTDVMGPTGWKEQQQLGKMACIRNEQQECVWHEQNQQGGKKWQPSERVWLE